MNFKHGKYGTPEYRAWRKMLDRCHNPRGRDYFRYGARGIFVCDEWRSDFTIFLSDIGLRPSSSHSIDRINNSLGYSAKNCKWATRKEQARNTRRNVFVNIFDEKLTLAEAVEHYSLVPYRIVHQRIVSYKWPKIYAIFEPTQTRSKSGV